MWPSTSDSPGQTSTPRLYWGVLVGFALLALVPTLWPALDLAAAGLFVGPTMVFDAGQWPWVVWINAYIPTVFRIMVLAALAGWLFTSVSKYGKRWRLHLAFLVLAGTLGPGLVVNLVFKDNWQRARPYQVAQFGGSQQFSRATVITDQCDSNCSFVSGHVACGIFFASLMLLQPRRRIVWACVGIAAGLVIGFARMADVAHWFSDVLWAFPITLLTSWFVWKLLIRVYPLQAGPVQHADSPR